MKSLPRSDDNDHDDHGHDDGASTLAAALRRCWHRTSSSTHTPNDDHFGHGHNDGALTAGGGIATASALHLLLDAYSK